MTAVPAPSTARSNAPREISVLYLIHGIGRAGPELRLLEFARRFPSHISMHVAVVGDDLTLQPEFEAAGASVLHFPVDRPYANPGAQRTLAAYVRKHGITVVNSFDLKTLMLALLVGVRVPSLRITHHLVSMWDDVFGMKRRIYQWLLHLTHALVCNGRGVRDGLVRSARLRARTTVILNGVDMQRFHPDPEARRRCREQLGLPPDALVFGTVSTMRPVKNVSGLLQAFRTVQGPTPPYLLCVGGGPGQAGAVAEAEALGIADRTRFVGEVGDPQTYLAAMDVFALPSLSEGNPNALLQALAVGLPAIGSRVGEIPYLLPSEQVGLLVPPGDTPALAAAMQRITTMDRHAMGQAALAIARQDLDADRMVAAYAAHMVSVAGATGAGRA